MKMNFFVARIVRCDIVGQRQCDALTKAVLLASKAPSNTKQQPREAQ